MSALSVVIPVYRDDKELQGLLECLKNLAVDEIIIADGENRPKPDFISRSSRKTKWLNAKCGRGSQIAAGINRAAHPIIWVLHADCRPKAGSELAVRDGLNNQATSLTCFPLSFRTRGLGLSLFAFLSRLESPLTTFGDQGYAFRKSEYDQLDLNLAGYPLLEDVALRAAFKRIGRVTKAAIDLPTSARRFERLGVWKTQVRNIRILLKYWTGTSPKTLHSQYYSPTRQTALSSQLSWLERQASRPAQAAAQRMENDSPLGAQLRLQAPL